MTRQITVTVETSRYADGSYWLPGAEYYVEDVELVVPDDFDDEQYSDDELQMMADDDKCAIVSYLHREEVQP
jgi:hypothetical protein